MSRLTERIVCSVAVVLAFVLAAPGATQVRAAEAPAAAEKTLAARSWKLNDFKRQLDGQWQGIRIAADGNVYFASSTHSAHHGAAFFRFDPRAGQVKMLCDDITRICGEDPDKTPQNKIHSDIAEADGWLYFATHYSCDKRGADAAYPGSHVIGYKLATEKFRDYGVVHANFTIYSGIGLDPTRSHLFVFVTPINDKGAAEGGGSRLYRIDARSGEKKDLGLLKRGSWGHDFHHFVDRRGDCWFTLGETNGTLFCARAESGRIDRWENALPALHSWRKDEVDPEARRQAGRWWRWEAPLPDGDRCVFAMQDGGALWLFDATKDVASGAAFAKLCHIGPGDLGMALGGGRVYYVQRANRQNGHKAKDLHLLSASLDPAAEPAIVDHGLILDQDGRRPWRIPSLAADAAGRVYMVGDWYLNDGEKGTLRYGYRNGEDVWRELWRGEFFAVADVSADLAVAGRKP